MTGPRVPDSTPPSLSERRISYASLLGKPTSLPGAGFTAAATSNFHQIGAEAIQADRDETVAGVYTVVAIRRNAVAKGFLGLNASDQLVLFAADGTTILATFATTGARLARTVGAGVNQYIALERSAGTKGFVGLDASDRLALIAADGVTVLAFMDPTTGWTAAKLEATTSAKAPAYFSGVNQVVGARGAAVANAVASIATGVNAVGNPPTGVEFNALVTQFNLLATDFNNAVLQINALLARLRSATGHGLFT